MTRILKCIPQHCRCGWWHNCNRPHLWYETRSHDLPQHDGAVVIILWHCRRTGRKTSHSLVPPLLLLLHLHFALLLWLRQWLGMGWTNKEGKERGKKNRKIERVRQRLNGGGCLWFICLEVARWRDWGQGEDKRERVGVNVGWWGRRLMYWLWLSLWSLGLFVFEGWKIEMFSEKERLRKVWMRIVCRVKFPKPCGGRDGRE